MTALPTTPRLVPFASRRLWWGALGLLVSGAVVALAVRHVDLRSVGLALGGVGVASVGIAVLLRILLLVAQSARWRVLLPVARRPAVRRLLLYQVIAGGVSWIAPLRPGEAVRVALLGQGEGIAWPAAAAAQAVEKVHEALGLFLLAAPLALGLAGRSVVWLRGVTLGLVILFALVLLALVLAARSGLLARSIATHPAGLIARLASGAASLRDGRRTLVALGLTLVGYGCEAAMVLVVARATAIPVGFATAALTLIALNAALLVPSAPGQLGTFEAAIVLALAPTGAPPSARFAMAVVLHGCHALADLGAAGIGVALLPHALRRPLAESRS